MPCLLKANNASAETSACCPYLLVVIPGPPDLVLVDGDAGHVRPANRRDGAQRTADTAATVKALHARLEAKGCSNTGLMGRLGCLPVLGRKLGGEVEALRARGFPCQQRLKAKDIKHAHEFDIKMSFA